MQHFEVRSEILRKVELKTDDCCLSFGSQWRETIFMLFKAEFDIVF